MKIKIAFVCIMTMFICCVLGFNSNAYELQPNGNIKSSNLLNISSLETGLSLDASNGVVTKVPDTAAHSSYEYVLLPYSSISSFSFNFNSLFCDDADNFLTICYYDSDKDYIHGYDYYGDPDELFYTISIPVRTAYIRYGVVSTSTPDISLFDLMLAFGNSPLAYDPYGTWVPQSQYNELQSSYDTLSQFNLYGWGTYIDAVDVIFSNGTSITYSKADLIKYNWLTTNATLNLFQLAQTNNPVYDSLVQIDIDFITIPPNDYTGFPISLFNLSVTNTSDAPSQFKSFKASIVDNMGSRSTLNVEQSSFFNSSSLSTLTGSLINFMSFTGSSPDAFASISLIGDSGLLYDRGYQNGNKIGYDNGYEEGKTIGYDSGKKEGYDSGYQVGYNKGISEDITSSGFTTLFNSILSYPTTMIKEVFNFEFMGINIANLITFIISIGIVAFVIKHFL